jgi:dipeptidyl aminopeptidase/acylaminoacyl peptidase
VVPVTIGAPLFSVPASSLSPSSQYETMWNDSDRVSFTSDGSTIVAFSGGALARIDAGSGAPGALTMLSPIDQSSTTRISRDGSRVYVPPAVIDTITSARVELTDVRLDVRGEFSPTGDRIVVPAVSRNGEGRAVVFDVATGAALFELTSDDVAITWATWSPDGSLLMTQGQVGVTRVWDALTGEQLLTLPDADSGSSFSPDGSSVVTVGPSERVRVRDARTGAQLALDEQLPAGSDPQAWFSADGTTVLVMHADPDVAGSAIATAWNASEGTLVGTIPGLAVGSEFSSGSYAGDRLVVLAADGSAQIWTITGSRELASVEPVSEAFISVGFSPDGRRLVALESDRTVRVWEVS